MPAHIDPQRSDRTEPPKLRFSVSQIAAKIFFLLTGIVFSLYLFNYVRTFQQTQFDSAFQTRIQQTNFYIRENISYCFEVLTSISDVCGLNPEFSREQFDLIAKRASSRISYLEALRWVPLVEDADRPAFEKLVKQQYGPNFRMTEYDSKGKMVDAPRRDFYFPVLYSAGSTADPPLIGYNIHSNAQLSSAMEQARKTGTPAMLHSWIKITETEGRRDYSYYVFVPIFAETGGAQPRRLIGYIQAVVSATKLIEAFITRSDTAGMAIEVRDFADPRNPQILFRSRDGLRVAVNNTDWFATPAKEKTVLDHGEVHWLLNFWPTQGNVGLADWWRLWSLPGLVLIISLLTGWYFVDSSLHSARMEAIVLRRTHELSETNRKLSREVTQRQRTEIALRDNEARLEGILTSMADSWVIVYDAEYRCESMWIPPELEKRYHLKPENFVGRRIQDITPASLAKLRTETVRGVMETGANMRIEFQMELPAAGEFWVEAALSPLRDESGRINAVICLMRDISERKRAEQALAESEGRYRSMVESQVDLVVRIDPAGRRTFVNDAYCRKTGLTVAQLIGRPEIDTVDEADHAAVEESINQILQPPHTRSSREQRMLTVDGTRWVHWESAAVLDERGNLVEIQSVGRDITERRQAEQEHLLLAEAVEQAAEAIFITDLDGIIHYVNPAFEHITGFARSEVLGTQHQILRRDRMNNDFYRRLWRMLEAGHIWRGHFTNTRKDGEVFDQLATISPVHDAAGMITHFVSVELDMTNEKRLERQLRQAERLATIGQTIAGVAHRLKNISALIRGSASLLDQAIGREDMASIKRLWPIFPRNSERLAGLATDMLNFSRVHELDLKPTDVNDLLRKLVEEYAASARQRGVELRFDRVQSMPLVRCDYQKMHDCVLNLVQNAVEACDGHKGCTVSVGTVFEEAQAVIKVVDDGPGIPPDVLPRIFDPFFSTKEEKGTGLGLPMTQKTIHGHGGSIRVESVPRHTVFSIFLPIVELTLPENAGVLDAAHTEV